MNTIIKYKYIILRFMMVTSIMIGILELTGCSPEMMIGGYQPVDMSLSHYREQIRSKADELAASQKTMDKRIAAELYGSIMELELMDKCIAEYFDMEPEMGMYLLRKGEKIHKFYELPH